MIKKVADYIDRKLFLQDVLSKVEKVDNIIVDSFVSNSCNLNCKHCYFLDYSPKMNSLPLEKWEELLFQWIDKGVKHFHFSGKEPFCDNKIQILLSHLNAYSDNSLYYGLVTNGTVNPIVFQELLQTNISYMEISIEGMASFNGQIRGNTHFQTVEKLISRLEDKSKINLTTTVFEQNINELTSLIRHFALMGIDKFNFSPYLEFSKSAISPISELSSHSILKFLKNCIKFLSSDNVLENPINIRVCLTESQCYTLFMAENFLTEKIQNYLYNGQPLTIMLGKHVLEIVFPLLTIPYMSQLVTTHDGYIISCADDIHFENIEEISLGNVWRLNIEDILIRRKQFIIDYINKILLK